MLYFFYLVEWLGVSCSCWRLPFATVPITAPSNRWSSNCSLYLWGGTLRLFGKLVGEKSFQCTSIFLLQKKTVTLGLYGSSDFLFLFSYILLSRLWCSIKAQRRKMLRLFTFSVLVILKFFSSSCYMVSVVTFKGILCSLLSVWKVVGGCPCSHSTVVQLMSQCVVWVMRERRSAAPQRWRGRAAPVRSNQR